MPISNQIHRHCTDLILTLLENNEANVSATDIESICAQWERVGSFASNLIRSANDRGIAVTIDHISGRVEITEPSDEKGTAHPDNFAMMKLMFDHFDTLQADALQFLQANLPMIDTTQTIQPEKLRAS